MRWSTLWAILLLLALAVIAFSVWTAHAAPLTFSWTVPLYEEGPASPDTACGHQADSDNLEQVLECELALWRFAYGDTIFLRVPCVGGDSMNVVTDIAPGTMAQAMERHRDYSSNWSCWSNSYLFVIPFSEFTPGLQGSYYTDQDLIQLADVRTDPVLDFNWGTGQPTPAISGDSFSARWEGKIRASISGDTVFRIRVNDACRLWIGSTQVIEDWGGDSDHSVTGTISLQAGSVYEIRAEMKEKLGSARMTLYWTQPGMPEEVVPASALTQ